MLRGGCGQAWRRVVRELHTRTDPTGPVQAQAFPGAAGTQAEAALGQDPAVGGSHPSPACSSRLSRLCWSQGLSWELAM